MNNQTLVLKKVLHRIRRYWVSLIAALLLATVNVVMTLYIPILVGTAIDCIVDAGHVNFAQMSVHLRNVLICAAVAGAAQWLMSELNNRMTFRITRDIRNDAFVHIQKLPLSYLDAHPQGDIVSRVIADADILSDGLLLGFTQLFSGVVTIGVTLAFMFSKNLWITLLVICLTPLSFWVAKIISSHSYGMFRKQSEARGKQTALIEEIIGNQKVVRAYGYEERASARFAAVNKELKAYSAQAIFYSSLTNPSTRFVNNLVYAGVALAGVLLVPGGVLFVLR